MQLIARGISKLFKRPLAHNSPSLKSKCSNKIIIIIIKACDASPVLTLSKNVAVTAINATLYHLSLKKN